MHPALAGLVPLPGQIELHTGACIITDATRVDAPTDPASAGVAGHFVRDVQAVCGLHLALVPSSGPGDIVVSLRPERHDLGAEGYELSIAPDVVQLTSPSAHGLWNGTRTLLQMFTPGANVQELPALHIIDVPRFEWRGAMLDVARHFFGVDQVIRFIELIARYKLNRLHLHLTDDQGWRIEIPGWPSLTSIGGSTAVGGGPGGWFSQQDWAEIVSQAAHHFVTIVPEIDLPGHTNAALASVPELNVDGRPPPLYTGRDVGFSSLRMHLPTTGRFIDEVIGSIVDTTPGRYIHVGGDEAHATDHHEYVAFIQLLLATVTGHGATMVGWEEIATAPLRDDVLVQHWLRPETAMAAPAGSRLIMSPAHHTYLDMRHAEDDPFGRRWAGSIDLDTAYEWDPAVLVVGVDERRIAGVEAPLWTEKVATFSEVEQRCFPRLACLAEVGWTPQASRQWSSARHRLAVETDRLAARGVNVYRSRVTHPD